ncbi:hypothetical protein CWE09_09110 [Aliidiomarina minuta]|uniref:histidine kinase n=1 Tax=Aliidiomarina minuta TaxID=880057 RepID=A0A432W9V9_9GAMM|nr:ATP-binding protein [Aliidiomarina minuta]RUO26831.1 hypothetical protein CWE09_09110 [Aliidiomarina minuta]
MMKNNGLSTGWQYFLAIAGVGLLLVLILLLGIRLYFIHNFSQYLEAQEEQRLQNMAVAISDYYESRRQEDPDFRLQQLSDLRSGEFRRLMFGLSVDQWREQRRPDDSDLAERPVRGGRLPMRQFSLHDVNGELISGRVSENPIRVTIHSDAEVIGFLETTRPDGPVQPIDDVFQQQQMVALFVAGGLAMLLAAFVAAFLAQRLRQRLKVVTDATRALALGDFSSRVPEKGNDDLTSLAQDFNALALSLEAAAAQRKNFMADMAHELRTPLTILQGELEAIEDGVRELNGQEMGLLQRQVRQLTQLIEDLHTLAEADAGSLSYAWQNVDLTQWLREQEGNLMQMAKKQGFDCSIELPEYPIKVQGDPVRLAQLLHNIWQNSLIYTDAPGNIHLTLEARDQVACLQIEDSAPGVPGASLPRLFERLYRVDTSRRRSAGGSGLGLALVERIAQAHGGTAVAEASNLGGLRIRVELPLLSTN